MSAVQGGFLAASLGALSGDLPTFRFKLLLHPGFRAPRHKAGTA